VGTRRGSENGLLGPEVRVRRVALQASLGLLLPDYALSQGHVMASLGSEASFLRCQDAGREEFRLHRLARNRDCVAWA